MCICLGMLQFGKRAVMLEIIPDIFYKLSKDGVNKLLQKPSQFETLLLQ